MTKYINDVSYKGKCISSRWNSIRLEGRNNVPHRKTEWNLIDQILVSKRREGNEANERGRSTHVEFFVYSKTVCI